MMTARTISIFLFAAALSSSCARSVRTVSMGSLGHPERGAPATQVSTIMKRQITNAADAGEGDVIVRNLRQRMTADPNNLQVRLDLARHYEATGNPELAAEHYRLAVAQFPESAEVAVGQARLMRKLELPGQALEGLMKFRAAHATVPYEVLCWIGILQDEAGELGKAEESYRAALALNPKSDSLHNNLGYNLLLRKKNAEAAGEFRKALEIAPHSQIARNNLGTALASQPKEAVLHMQSVSDPATAHSNLAAVLIEQGLYPEARAELKLALGYRNDHPAALSNLQLLSELDGKAFAVQSRIPDSRWRRFGRGFKNVLFGTDEQVHTVETVKTASK